MVEVLKNYKVTVPTEYVGHAIGHLSGIGGWIDGVVEAGGAYSVVSVRLPRHVDGATVKKVLEKIVQGNVSIVDEAANEEDA